DRHPRSLCQVVPERSNGRMSCAPLLDDRLHIGVAATVVAGDPPPCADRSTKSAGEFGVFSELPLRCGDLADRCVLAQHAMSKNPIEIECLVAGGIKALEGFQLPSLTGEPGVDAALDGAEVGADKHVPGSGAQRRA